MFLLVVPPQITTVSGSIFTLFTFEFRMLFRVVVPQVFNIGLPARQFLETLSARIGSYHMNGSEVIVQIFFISETSFTSRHFNSFFLFILLLT